VILSTGSVEGRRPAAPGAPPGPVGLLVITLRDGVRDPASPQRRPVGAAAIGLVPGQMRHAGTGPASTTRASNPHPVHQPDQLAGIGVLAWGKASGQVATATVADRMELGGQPTA
jgi:hypothetical protein